MMATICGRFRLELDPQMGGEAGVLERQISSFTLAVDGGLFIQFHDRAQVGHPLLSDAAASRYRVALVKIGYVALPWSYKILGTKSYEWH